MWNKLLYENSREAMVTLYNEHYSALLSYGTQLCNNSELAKDAINDVFINLWNRRESLSSIENIKAYLYTCIRRQIFQSSKYRVTIPSYGIEAELPYEELIIEMQTSEEIRKKVQQALAKLSSRQKELIEMKFFQSMNYKEIQDQTGISVKTAYNTLYSAFQILAKELSGIISMLWVIFNSI